MNKNVKRLNKERKKRIDKHRTKYKKRGGIPKPVLGVLLGAAALGVIYLGMSFYFKDRFYFSTYINGHNYAGKSVDEVESRLKKDIADYSLLIMQRNDKEESLGADDIDLTYVPTGEVQKLMDKQNSFAWVTSFIHPRENDVSVTVEYDADLLEQAVNSLEGMQEQNMESPVNAFIEFGSGAYVIRPEKNGTCIDREKLHGNIREAVEAGVPSIDLDKLDSYVKPEYTSQSEKLVSSMEQLNNYMGITITYDFDDRTETVNGEQIHNWIKIDEDFKISFDETEVREFVNSLARKTNTFANKRDFVTAGGKKITIQGGDYGWLINREKETKELIAVIQEGKSVTREPVYTQTGVSRKKDDIGSTYVEIDLNRQHMWYYLEGKQLVSTPIVTGNISKDYGTPPGIYAITYKERDATLNGENYSSPVNYWMPFNKNIGLHDATWRSDFGGDIYKTSGSHGCVNTPYANAKIIYENIKKGIPVILY